MDADFQRAATDASLRLQERFHALSRDYDQLSSIEVVTGRRHRRLVRLAKEMDRIERALARLDGLHGPVKEESNG